MSFLSQLFKKKIDKILCFVLFKKKKEEEKRNKLFKDFQRQDDINFKSNSILKPEENKFSKMIKKKGYHFSKRKFQIPNFKLQISNFKFQMSKKKKKSFSKDYTNQPKFFFLKREIQIIQIKKLERKIIHLKTTKQQSTHN